jgi:hypothetical protein
VILAYAVFPYLFFAAGTNFIQTPLAPGDGGLFGVPTKMFTAGSVLWDPYIQGGTFPAKDIGWQSLYVPGIVVMRLFPNPFGYNLLLLAHYSMAGFFTFLFLRKLRLTNAASFIGGLTFMFCGFLAAHKGHHSMMMTASYLPVVLFFIESFMSSNKLASLCLAASAFALSILADYTAVSVYIGMVSFPYIIFRVLCDPERNGQTLLRRIRTILSISSAVYVAAFALAAVEIIPVLESLPYVNRQQISYDFFASYSFRFSLLPMLLFPYAYGTQSPGLYHIPYFGPWNLTEMAGYMGILPLLFAALAAVFFRKASAQIYFWTGVAIFGFLLVLGDSTPFYQLMYRVPIYNLFRASARNWLEVNFAVAVLSSFFVDHIKTGAHLPKAQYYRTVHLIAAALAVSAFLVLVVSRSVLPPRQWKQLWLENTQITSSAAYIPLLIMSFSIAILYLLFRFRGARGFWPVVIVFIFLDLFSFGHFHDTAYPSYAILRGQPSPIATFLELSDPQKTQYRLLPLNATDYENQLYPAINLLYRFNVTNGYSSIWLRDYQDLTDFETNGIANQKYRLLRNSTILSLLATKYVITADPQDEGFLQTLLVGPSPTPNQSIVDGLNSPAWNFTSSGRAADGAAVLQSPAEGQVSLIQFPFSIQPRTWYTIAFKAMRVGASSPTDLLIVDFFGQNYDSLSQEEHFDGALSANQFHKFNVQFYSGDATPNFAYLRFFTFSKTPYEVQNVQLLKGGGNVPYWGGKKLGPVAAPLYAKKFASAAGVIVYENINFLPRARFVSNVRVVKDTPQAIQTLWDDVNFDPSTTALVEDYHGDTTLDAGQVVNADYSKASSVTLSVTTGEKAFFLLADTWYPGWRAYVDGRQTAIYKTNAVSRGILVEGAGQHAIVFRFVPTSLYVGLSITTVALALIITTILLERAQAHKVICRPG